ncbi:hypothetical protein GCM10009527_092620 [Actinomadura nitritigenes]
MRRVSVPDPGGANDEAPAPNDGAGAMRYNTIYPALRPGVFRAGLFRHGRGDRGCVTVNHRPIRGAAVPVRRD